jgi:hypothetical protein
MPQNKLTPWEGSRVRNRFVRMRKFMDQRISRAVRLSMGINHTPILNLKNKIIVITGCPPGHGGLIQFCQSRNWDADDKHVQVKMECLGQR